MRSTHLLTTRARTLLVAILLTYLVTDLGFSRSGLVRNSILNSYQVLTHSSGDNSIPYLLGTDLVFSLLSFRASSHSLLTHTISYLTCASNLRSRLNKTNSINSFPTTVLVTLINLLKTL